MCSALWRAYHRPDRAALLPPDGLGLLVFTQADELRVPQVILPRPLEKLELPHELRLQPPAVRHLRLRQPLPPAAALRFGQVRERAFLDLEPAKLSEQLRPGRRCEAIPG